MPGKRIVVPVEERDWYTPNEAAARLGLSKTSLYRQAQLGTIESIVLPRSGATAFMKTTIEKIRAAELRGSADDPPGPVWPGGLRELPPGANFTTVLEVSRG